MTTFKPKTSKKIKVEEHEIETLDNHFDKKLNYFKEIENIKIPKLIKKINELNKKYNEEVDFLNKMNIENEIEILKNQCNKLYNAKQKYIMNNMNYIFDYFEDKKNIRKDETKKKIVNNFFNMNNTTKTEKKTDCNNIKKYFINQDDKYITIDDFEITTDQCPKCNNEMVQVEYDGVLVCKNKFCGYQTKFLIDIDKPNYKEPPKEVTFYAYQKSNHFKEILSQFQAKESTQIPEEVIKKIKYQIKKERITIHDLTNEKTKQILKKLGYNKYYEHIPFIKEKLGIKPPLMSPKLEEKLCNLFMEIQTPYSKYCPNDRTNFLNYYYVLYKLCELLDETKYLPFFPMLKDQNKRMEQDEIWSKICNDLEWEFIPTI